MTTILIEQKLAAIPSEYLSEVADFLDYLSYKIAKNQSTPNCLKRTPGRMKGDIYMSDDFDAPIDDFKAYM